MQIIAVDKFIDAIRRRPALWDWHSEDYKDRDLKKQGWLDVCQIMCPKFADKDEEERSQIGKDIQLKWKNLRDAYVRHIRVKMGMSKSRRPKPMRAYIYHNQMAFLRKVINPRSRTRRFLYAGTSHDVKEEEGDLTQEDLMELVEYDMNSSAKASTSLDDGEEEEEEEEEEQKSESVGYVDPLLEVEMSDNEARDNEVRDSEVRDSEVRDSDDMNFFKSLLPSLQTLRVDQKLKFRIDVMELLMTYHQAATEQNE